MSSFSQIIKTRIGGDSRYPCGKCAIESEAIQLLVNLYKHLLINVLSFALRPGDPKSNPKNRFIMGVYYSCANAAWFPPCASGTREHSSIQRAASIYSPPQPRLRWRDTKVVNIRSQSCNKVLVNHRGRHAEVMIFMSRKYLSSSQ